MKSRSLTRVIRNTKTLLTNPQVARDYLLYWKSKMANGGQAVRRFPDGTQITDLCDFGEFHAIGDFVSQQERTFFATYPIGEGAILDVGANLGLVSFILAKQFPERTIYAFEPAPSTFRSLKTNIELNGCRNIQALPYAIADRDGEIIFRATPMGRGTNSIATGESQDVVQVPCMTLDTFVEKNSLAEIAFLKVDVEGFEALVFEGAKQLLKHQQVAVIYYEVCPENVKNSGIEPELATRILSQHGYRTHKLSESGHLEAVDHTVVKQTVLENWIAFRP